ncbi:MAG: hypothetical protein ACRDIA_07750, partial [Actinomycetota bacterium]
ARILMTLWLAFGVLGALAVAGAIPAPVASPEMWLMVPWALLSCLGGHLAAGLREELPRHHFGWRHQIAVPAVAAVAVVGFITAWVPPLGNWGRSPQAFAAGLGDDEAASIGSFLKSTAEQAGEFRVLWLGDRWLDPIRAGSPRIQGPPYLITGSSGLDMQEAFRPPPSEGDRRLEDTIGSLMGRRVHLAGHLLAPAGIRFIVADSGDEASIGALRIQRDMALEQQQGSIALFRNLQWLPRAVLAPATLTPKAAASDDETELMLTRWSGGRKIPQRGQSEFSLRLPRTLHSQILLGDNFNESWRAKASRVRLKHLPAFGWANRFVLSSADQGEVRVYFGTRWLRFAWLAFQALIFLVVAAVALARRRETLGRLR